MLVFGDRSESVDPSERLAQIIDAVERAARMRTGLARHSAIAAALIDSGRLLQGIVDADFAKTQTDRATPDTNALGQWVLGLARMLCRSWDSARSSVGEPPLHPEVLDLPGSVELKTPEGFAFYALYPEAYAEAARRLSLRAPPRIIGLRSIGTSLASIVAAALDAEPPVTVRPFGDPYARKVALDPALERQLLSGTAHYVIVDEGPGQSGSSFGGVADWLQARGVPLERIAFLPSHGGPLGPQASDAHRRRWSASQRQVGDFGDRLPALVAGWAADALGIPGAETREISGGEWRRLLFDDESDWPVVIPMFERRKILLSSGDGRFVARFAGLGAMGESKLRIARALHGDDFVPEPIGLAHGFLVERWVEGTRPLSADDRPSDEIGRYLGTRARLFPVSDADGASIRDLYAMAKRNVALGLGDDALPLLEMWEPQLDGLQRRLRRVRTDNRMDRHEWLRTPEGRLLKCDALDHHQGHDLIGCQDVAWDVAGAVVEFALTNAETERLIAATELASGERVDRDLLGIYLLAYPAFRHGVASLGSEMAGEETRDRQRIDAAKVAYRIALGQALERSSRTTRQQGPVGQRWNYRRRNKPRRSRLKKKMQV